MADRADDLVQGSSGVALGDNHVLTHSLHYGLAVFEAYGYKTAIGTAVYG